MWWKYPAFSLLTIQSPPGASHWPKPKQNPGVLLQGSLGNVVCRYQLHEIQSNAEEEQRIDQIGRWLAQERIVMMLATFQIVQKTNIYIYIYICVCVCVCVYVYIYIQNKTNIINCHDACNLFSNSSENKYIYMYVYIYIHTK